MSANRTTQNAQLFNSVADTYDELGFLTLAARFLAGQVTVTPGIQILEVGTGTGVVALELAARGAVVTGVDLAPGMVARAQEKAQGVPGVKFMVADGMNLPFPDKTFEVVVSAATLFFMPHMVAALREWRRGLKLGGRVVFSSFGRGLLGPLPALWREELAAYGLKPASPPLGRIPTPETARALLLEAGFSEVQVTLTELPYLLPSPQARWAEITAGLEGMALEEFTLPQREEVAVNHLARLESLPWPQVVPVPVIVASGRADF